MLLRVKKKYVVSFSSVTVKTKIGIISKPELWLNLVLRKWPPQLRRLQFHAHVVSQALRRPSP